MTNEYRVIGPRPYRGYKPGEVLIADPADQSVQRALAMKTLELVGKSSSRLKVTRPNPGRLEAEAEAAVVDEPASDDDGGT